MEFTNSDYWKAIILYGLNASTYKMGFGLALIEAVRQNKNELKFNNSDNLKINVTEDVLDNKNLEDFQGNLFENFTEINDIIVKLKTIEKEKHNLISELDQLMSSFEIRKNSLDKKLTNIQKEKEMYDKAINLINSLKNV